MVKLSREKAACIDQDQRGKIPTGKQLQLSQALEISKERFLPTVKDAPTKQHCDALLLLLLHQPKKTL